ncbi:phosphoribosylglycinamide formyltransferase-1 [Hydrocarboniphaga daqingensis]|uniref:Phosphoribosylglycinamide formyltransferase n=1 Tax=Hydrocarboniphaga daqingensis TaxID=490188 RepID=A0A1M5K1M1_9GAMM|nr:phosphoribosylglycinamide formyltransferase [Hydrocarboniphaga daqingensis]SHG46696.1 phosphoribosylglycinamide formyltransferase-1 [Hydrocarboniphaga daqingensis]
MSALPRLVVLISGRGRNLQAIVDATRSGRLRAEVALVLSNRSDAAGLDYARAAGIPTQVIRHQDHADRASFDAQMLAVIEPLQPALVVLAGFMRILTLPFIRALQGRLVNIHPSLLPLYPGLNTHARALQAGDAEHGASVHWVTEELDGGPVIAQGRVRIEPGDTPETLGQRVLEQVEVRLYPEVLQQLLTEPAAR